MSRKSIISIVAVVVVLGVVVSVSLAFRMWNRKTDVQVLAELDQKSRKWQSSQDTLNKLLEQLRKDKATTRDKLLGLGVKSESDLSEKPMAQVLNTERLKINKQIWLCEKKIDSLNLAILKADAKKKDITRKQQLGLGGLTATEVREAMEELASTETALAEPEPLAPPDKTIAEDLNLAPELPHSPELRHSPRPIPPDLNPVRDTRTGPSKRGEIRFPSPPAQMRTWTKADGATFEAVLIRQVGGTGLFLKQRDGKEITITQPMLSAEDKKYVRRMTWSQ